MCTSHVWDLVKLKIILHIIGIHRAGSQICRHKLPHTYVQRQIGHVHHSHRQLGVMIAGPSVVDQFQFDRTYAQIHLEF